ncbi:hypothetical protein J3R73_005287 [Labrys monachus]|uniref:Uncharacterized protein n=1 Tax=Labrys monachus TaxID=217067 RepID=A0ABU0FLM4_9HYPH|nr:hypothetical protein [Labrys monachus]
MTFFIIPPTEKAVTAHLVVGGERSGGANLPQFERMRKP